MANLSTILADRIPQTVLDSVSAGVIETNLKDGRIWAYTPGFSAGGFSRDVCWRAPGNGTAVIEIWGAGGSGAGGCCCYGGIPGNPGAYVKKTITVAANDWVSGVVGISCGNSSTIGFRGCSTSTCITICTTAGCSCLCAQGGAGGVVICQTGASQYCCFVASAYCGTLIANGCGVLCNNVGAAICSRGLAYGGDVNCPGCLSCMTFWRCDPTNTVNLVHIAYPAGLFSTDGGWITYEDGSCFTDSQFSSLMPYSQAIMGMNAQAMGFNQGAMIHCWASNTQCGCYRDTGCSPHLPPGMPGMSGVTLAGQQSSGQRGGHGALKITFIGS